MRVLITSNSHPSYNQVGTIVNDFGDKGIEVRLDNTGHVVGVSDGQWKAITRQDAQNKREDSELATYAAAEGVLGILGGMFS